MWICPACGCENLEEALCCCDCALNVDATPEEIAQHVRELDNTLDALDEFERNKLCPFLQVEIIEWFDLLFCLLNKTSYRRVWEAQPCIMSGCRLWDAERGICSLTTGDMPLPTIRH